MRYLLWHGVSESAERSPAACAVADAHGALSYGELEAASDAFAAALRAWGVQRGDRIGILAPKSGRCITAMLGALKAGVIYVPVDPASPPSRWGAILRDAGARALVVASRLLEDLHEAKACLPELVDVVVSDAAPPTGFDAGDLRIHEWEEVSEAGAALRESAHTEHDPAYILYTSGSTGMPKGVVISHRNALSFVEWGVRTFGVKAEDRLSNHAPLHFDLSVFDIYAALHAGARVVLVPDRVAPFPAELASWIHEQLISIWYSVPSALIRLLGHGQLDRYDYSALRQVLFAGEVFPVKHLREVMARFRHAEFYNLYGPTETNVCTYLRVPRPLPEEITDLSIGAACDNADAFAITESGQLAEPGEEGELLVRGATVMLGYWGLPERTGQCVVQNPLHSVYRDPVCRTGDVVRVREDGTFAFLGRRDHMVKSRGYRIELGEVEHVLHQFDGVTGAAVVAVPDEEVGARLHAVIVVERPAPESDFRRFCQSRLPRYAVPESFVFLDKLPMTSTGKVDRQALVQSIVPPV